MNRLFHSYAPYKGAIATRHNGGLVSIAAGRSVAYALWNLEERGMIIGRHSRGRDIDVNPMKTKQLTNIRASGTDEAVVLTPPIRMTLEKAISYIADDELVEVTPQSIRLRKRQLDPVMRKREARRAEAIENAV